MSADDCGIFEKHCKPEFEKIHQSMNELNNRLFKDNGSPSIQTKVDRNSRLIKATIGASVPVYLGLIGLFFKWVWSKMTGA